MKAALLSPVFGKMNGFTEKKERDSRCVGACCQAFVVCRWRHTGLCVWESFFDAVEISLSTDLFPLEEGRRHYLYPLHLGRRK
ncbi:MAG: hypothetical protein U1F34_02325 [Gammaproteobacteria bacterium]